MPGAAVDGAAPAAPFETGPDVSDGETDDAGAFDDAGAVDDVGDVDDAGGADESGCCADGGELTAPQACTEVPAPQAWITILCAVTTGTNVKANAAPHETAAPQMTIKTNLLNIGRLYHFSRFPSRNSSARRAARSPLRAFPRWW